MRIILPTLISLCIVSSALLHLSPPMIESKEEFVSLPPVATSTYDVAGSEYDTMAYSLDYEADWCMVRVPPYDFTIGVHYVEPNDEYHGQWSSGEYIIRLNTASGMNVGTVAHEVSHAVDTIMEGTSFEDDHYEAYLQGAFTYCVWRLVEDEKKTI